MNRTRTAASACGALAVVGALWYDSDPRSGAQGAPGPGGPAVTRAARLARAPDRLAHIRSPTLTVRTARRFASKRQRSIPLPDGGNFNGIRWRNAPDPLTPGAAEQTLEYNARCQWMRAAAEQRTDEAQVVVRMADKWPALRSLPPAGAMASLLASCYASHAREVRHATRLQLVPSS